jgi:hypothetical protein
MRIPRENFEGVQPISLLGDGFRPISQIATAIEDQFIEDGTVCKEYDEDDHFVGQRWDCHVPSFQVLCYLYEGYFVAVRLQMAIINRYGLRGQNLIQIVTQRSQIVYWFNISNQPQGHNSFKRHIRVGTLKLDCFGR